MDDPPLTDPATAAGVRYVLAGGERWALSPERAIARNLAEAYPGLGRMMAAAYEWHRLTAGRAAAGELGKPAAGLVFCGGGLRPPGLPLHAYADQLSPGIRVVYTDPGKRTVQVNEEFLAAGSGGRVSVAVARPADPAAVLGSAPCAELLAAGPVSVHVVICASRWPPGKAPGMVAGYARLLPPGSSLAMTVVAPDRDAGGNLTPEAAAMTEAASLAGGPGYAHTAAGLAGWLEGAGMTVPEGAGPLRTFRVAPRVPGRAVGAYGIVP